MRHTAYSLSFILILSCLNWSENSTNEKRVWSLHKVNSQTGTKGGYRWFLNWANQHRSTQTHLDGEDWGLPSFADSKTHYVSGRTLAQKFLQTYSLTFFEIHVTDQVFWATWEGLLQWLQLAWPKYRASCMCTISPLFFLILGPPCEAAAWASWNDLDEKKTTKLQFINFPNAC